VKAVSTVQTHFTVLYVILVALASDIVYENGCIGVKSEDSPRNELENIGISQLTAHDACFGSTPSCIAYCAPTIAEVNFNSSSVMYRRAGNKPETDV
jgi:hypothetical protein